MRSISERSGRLPIVGSSIGYVFLAVLLIRSDLVMYNNAGDVGCRDNEISKDSSNSGSEEDSSDSSEEEGGDGDEEKHVPGAVRGQ